MPSPLSPIEPNMSTPQRAMTSTPLTTTSDNDHDNDNDNSSPFMSDASPQNSHSAPRPRPMSRIISGGELSPLKIVQQQQSQNVSVSQQQAPPAGANEETPSPAKSMPPPPLPQSPRKISGAPVKRFPIKVNSTPAANGTTTNGSAKDPPRAYQRRISLHDAIQENPGLKHAIEIFEDDESMLDIEPGDRASASQNADDSILTASDPSTAPLQGHVDHESDRQPADDEVSGMDDTMVSTFSNFSSVPNMTMLAQMRSNSPTKFSLPGGSTPRVGRPDPSPSRTPHAGPLPDRSAQHDSGGSNNTTNLLDFNDRFSGYPQQTPSRDRHLSPSRSAAQGGVSATPQRSNLVNLLDFDIPPMPTPRSIPTITPRELESLKSNFLSEISSLKASLSGKEAEVMSLKTAVGDAEKRVGECMEHLRDLRGEHESLVTERDSWEKRGREMESVLRKVKEEIVHGQREREDLEFKLDEAEKRREAAEMMAQDAESKMAGMRAGKASAEAAAANAGGVKAPVGGAGSNKEVEMAVERVARELHALYKSKHEVKVAALKKSYEGRWEKRVRELQTQVDELTKDNGELRVGRDINTSKVDLARLAELEEERKKEKAKDTTHIKELEAELEKLEAMLKTVQGDNAELRVLLERERVEKGELVMLAEEMMNMQQQQTIMAAEQQQQREEYERRQRQNQEYERQQRQQDEYERQQRQQDEYERQQRQQDEYERQQQQREREERRSSNGTSYTNGNGHRTSRSSSSSSSATLNNDNAPAATPALMSLGNKTPGRRNTVAPPSRGTPLTAKRNSVHVSSSGLGDANGNAAGVSSFRNSISAAGRPSSLRAPGGISGLAKPTESRIGRVGGVGGGADGHARNKSHGLGIGLPVGLPRPGSGLGMASSRGIMSSIEKMGNGGRGYGARD